MVGACFFVLIIASISNIPSVENRHFVHVSRVNSEEFLLTVLRQWWHEMCGQ